LSYIWHDNSGRGANASWFLKFVIVHDLQTREKSYFICNKWLSVEEDDGRIDRILPASSAKQKQEIAYLIEKETKDNLRDGHLWFSIIGRPTLSSFTRTDRLTCCFVLLLMTALLNIMYYMNDTTAKTGLLKIGPFSISQTQIMIGLIYFKLDHFPANIHFGAIVQTLQAV
jgi:polycystin 1L2